MKDLKGQLTEVFGIMLFEGEVSFRACENHCFGPGGTDDFQIQLPKFAEGGLIPTPECIMSAAALISADDGFHAHLIQQGEDASGRFRGIQVQIRKNHIKIGEASHKIVILPLLLEYPSLLCPCDPLLFDVQGLQAGDCKIASGKPGVSPRRGEARVKPPHRWNTAPGP